MRIHHFHISGCRENKVMDYLLILLSSSCTRRDLGWMLGNITYPKKCSLEWAAQGSGGVTDPGGVQGTLRCCTEGHGLVGNTGDKWTVGLVDFDSLFQPW